MMMKRPVATDKADSICLSISLPHHPLYLSTLYKISQYLLQKDKTLDENRRLYDHGCDPLPLKEVQLREKKTDS